MNDFTKKDTTAIKGVSVCMLLWHHLFYTSDINGAILNNNISGVLAYYFKVCVAIFVFLTGYGLYKSFSKGVILKDYYLNSLKKLYYNYWFIWILFVPLGILFFNRTLEIVYEKDIIKNLLLTLTGFQTMFGQVGYNATWWYMGLVVGLYLIFPFMNKLIDKTPYLVILISFFMLFIEPKKIFNLNFIGLYGEWLFPFCLGIIWSKYDIFEKIKNINLSKVTKFIMYFFILIIISLLRKADWILSYTKIDGFYTIVILQIIFEFLTNKKIKGIFSFIGKHSFNIFLTHTFIYLYYLNYIIYSYTSDIVKFLILLIISLLISVVIENLKVKLHLI